jgi:hypothetical protein
MAVAIVAWPLDIPPTPRVKLPGLIGISMMRLHDLRRSNVATRATAWGWRGHHHHSVS